MNTKVVSRLISSAMKESKSSLSGAVKVFTAMVGNTKDLQSIADILKSEKSINVTKEEIKLIVDLCKDKNELVRVCASMLAKIDDAFVTFVLYEKKSDNIQDSFKRSEEWDINNVVLGENFKPFGDFSPSFIANGTRCPKIRTIEKDGILITYICVAIKSYTPSLVAKCVIAYLKAQEEKK